MGNRTQRRPFPRLFSSKSLPPSRWMKERVPHAGNTIKKRNDPWCHSRHTVLRSQTRTRTSRWLFPLSLLPRTFSLRSSAEYPRRNLRFSRDFYFWHSWLFNRLSAPPLFLSPFLPIFGVSKRSRATVDHPCCFFRPSFARTHARVSSLRSTSRPSSADIATRATVCATADLSFTFQVGVLPAGLAVLRFHYLCCTPSR